MYQRRNHTSGPLLHARAGPIERSHSQVTEKFFPPSELFCLGQEPTFAAGATRPRACAGFAGQKLPSSVCPPFSHRPSGSSYSARQTGQAIIRRIPSDLNIIVRNHQVCSLVFNALPPRFVERLHCTMTPTGLRLRLASSPSRGAVINRAFLSRYYDTL